MLFRPLPLFPNLPEGFPLCHGLTHSRHSIHICRENNCPHSLISHSFPNSLWSSVDPHHCTCRSKASKLPNTMASFQPLFYQAFLWCSCDIVAFLFKLFISLNSVFSARPTTFPSSLLRNPNPQGFSSAFFMAHLHIFPKKVPSTLYVVNPKISMSTLEFSYQTPDMCLQLATGYSHQAPNRYSLNSG